MLFSDAGRLTDQLLDCPTLIGSLMSTYLAVMKTPAALTALAVPMLRLVLPLVVAGFRKREEAGSEGFACQLVAVAATESPTLPTRRPWGPTDTIVAPRGYRAP